MNRRGFLGGVLAASLAPAIVRADSLMRLYVPPQSIVPVLWGDGIHDDAAGLEAFLNGREFRSNIVAGNVLQDARLRLSRGVRVAGGGVSVVVANCHFFCDYARDQPMIWYFDDKPKISAVYHENRR